MAKILIFLSILVTTYAQANEPGIILTDNGYQFGAENNSLQCLSPSDDVRIKKIVNMAKSKRAECPQNIEVIIEAPGGLGISFDVRVMNITGNNIHTNSCKYALYVPKKESSELSIKEVKCKIIH